MAESAIDYCRRREREERLGLAQADTDAARDPHAVMADRYADRAWSIQEGYDTDALA